jgi:hypothetical protein
MCPLSVENPSMVVVLGNVKGSFHLHDVPLYIGIIKHVDYDKSTTTITDVLAKMDMPRGFRFKRSPMIQR